MATSAACTDGDAYHHAASSSGSPDEDLSDFEMTSAALHWRMDPTESHSDWKLKITCRNQREAVTYHVHKCVLAVGPRKSEYFARLFSNGGRFAESQACTSTIELEQVAASSFSHFLDYVYNDTDFSLASEQCVALHWFAKYFEMRHLRWLTKRFIKQNLTSTTCATYYEQARALRDDSIMTLLAQYCATTMGDGDDDASITSSRLVTVAGAKFWLLVNKHAPADHAATALYSRNMSKCIAGLLRSTSSSKHSTLLLESPDLSSFVSLTAQKNLPCIHGEAALALLEIQRQLSAVSDASTAVDESLNNLQNRCVDALVRSWETVDLTSDRALALLNKQSAAVLAKILCGSVQAARKCNRSLKRKVDVMSLTRDESATASTSKRRRRRRRQEGDGFAKVVATTEQNSDSSSEDGTSDSAGDDDDDQEEDAEDTAADVDDMSNVSEEDADDVDDEGDASSDGTAVLLQKTRDRRPVRSCRKTRLLRKRNPSGRRRLTE